MTPINRLAQALGYVKLAKQSLDLAPTAEFYEAWALEKLGEVESALITGITDTSTTATSHETLQAEIQALKERVTALEQIEKKRMYDEAYNDYLNGDLDEIIESSVKEARQLTRDDIIEMAKRDVAELAADIPMHYPYNYADFVVNRDKRTVVALLRIFKRGEVRARGIAKCHPDDCFNSAIGRAIALRRALGLEVPEAYLNAPQPTEVRVGDILDAGNEMTLYRFIGEQSDGKLIVESLLNGHKYNDCERHWFKIIDDSRE